MTPKRCKTHVTEKLARAVALLVLSSPAMAQALDLETVLPSLPMAPFDDDFLRYTVGDGSPTIPPVIGPPPQPGPGVTPQPNVSPAEGIAPVPGQSTPAPP